MRTFVAAAFCVLGPGFANAAEAYFCDDLTTLTTPTFAWVTKITFEDKTKAVTYASYAGRNTPDRSTYKVQNGRYVFTIKTDVWQKSYAFNPENFRLDIAGIRISDGAEINASSFCYPLNDDLAMQSNPLLHQAAVLPN
jgi:hypothetical protein